MLNQKFEFEKTVQALNYMICKLDLAHITKLDALKLIFLADRYHLRKYGRMITNDEYWAMTYGPVASSVKDVVELGDLLDPEEKKYAQQFLSKCNKHLLKSISKPDCDVLSETDIEALETAVALKKKYHNLVDFTHQFTEWKRHSSNIKTLNHRKKMDLLDFFKDSDDSIEYCDVPKDLLQLNKAHFIDSMKFSYMWG